MLRIVAENVHHVHIAAGVEHQVRVDGTHHLLTALASIPDAAEYVERGTICVDPVALLRKFRLLKKPLVSWMRPPSCVTSMFATGRARIRRTSVNGADAVEAGRLGAEKAVELGFGFGGVNGASPSEAAEKAVELGFGFDGVNGASPSEAAEKAVELGFGFDGVNGASPSEAAEKAVELGFGFDGVNGASPSEAAEKAVELGFGFDGVNGASPSEAAEKAVELGFGFDGVNGASPSEAAEKAVELGFGFDGVNGASPSEAAEKAVELGFGFDGVNGASPSEAAEKAVELGFGFDGVNGASPSEAAEKAVELGFGFDGVNGADAVEACRRSNKAQGKAAGGERAGVCALSGLTGKKGKLLCPNSGQHGPWRRWGPSGLALCGTCYKRNHNRERRGHPEQLDPGLKPLRR
ncbi:hypothetical protein HYH03_017573 [Edaphochlamys debaryana]|uniref:Uncharacterized protein n=1 Tax=Edaphochlamys debaryana TaxID=47281 RepID=A0A836BNS0_9CHLO|nr:hypothetical protein HYH03_017573 [Edaphochlamys debaryana]|eukprot:KAG2483566.1 hypothetical protein HYH03_017573 [Edaphochlamys debaryana]